MTVFFSSVLFFDGLLAGVFLCSSLIEHAMRTLEAPHWLAYAQAKEKVFGPVMPVFFGIGLLFTIILGSVMVPHTLPTLAAVLLVAAGIITKVVNLPLNARFRSWTAETIPGDWWQDRSRWRTWNVRRTLLAIAAFAALLVWPGA